MRRQRSCPLWISFNRGDLRVCLLRLGARRLSFRDGEFVRDEHGIASGGVRTSKPAHIERYNAATDVALETGFLLPADAPEIKAVAAESFPFD